MKVAHTIQQIPMATAFPGALPPLSVQRMPRKAVDSALSWPGNRTTFLDVIWFLVIRMRKEHSWLSLLLCFHELIIRLSLFKSVFSNIIENQYVLLFVLSLFLQTDIAHASDHSWWCFVYSISRRSLCGSVNALQLLTCYLSFPILSTFQIQLSYPWVVGLSHWLLI